MSVTSLDPFDTTVHKTNAWLNELRQELGWDDRHAAYLALRATLHALRDRITVEEVAQLGAQLPMLVRGFYYEGWDPTGKPVRDRRKETFLLRIAQQFPSADLLDPEKTAARAFGCWPGASVKERSRTSSTSCRPVSGTSGRDRSVAPHDGRRGDHVAAGSRVCQVGGPPPRTEWPRTCRSVATSISPIGPRSTRRRSGGSRTWSGST